MKKKKLNNGQLPLSEVQQAIEDSAHETGKPRGMPPISEVRNEVLLEGLTEADASQLYDYWLGNGFKTGRHTVKSWRAVIRTWKCNGWFNSQKESKPTEAREQRGLQIMRRMREHDTHRRPSA